MNLEAVAALVIVVAGWLDFVAVFSLSRRGTHLLVPVGTWQLPSRLRQELERESVRGFRVVPLGAGRYLLRPVLWFEKEPSAAPQLVSMATAAVEAGSVRVRVYAPLAAVLIALLIPWVLVPTTSPLALTACIAIGAALLAATIATYKAEFGACFDRLERAWQTAPENNKMQQTSHG
jgi:hypothetical protein